MKKLFVLALAIFLSLSAFQFSPVSAQSNLTAELLSTINSLQAQVMALQGQIAARSNQNNFPTSTGAWLTVTKSGNGSGLVTSNPAGINCGSDCSELYATGTIVWLYASASQGSVFNSWTGCDIVSSTSCRVAMNYNRIVNARFDATSTMYTLTVTKSGSGTGLVWSNPSGINCGSDCSETYASGTLVWLHANPNSGSRFSSSSGWTGCDSFSSSGSCRVVMNSNRTVNARFDLINSPPEITYVSGPTRLGVNTTGTWTVNASDIDGNLNFWDVSWGDNSSSTRTASGSSSEAVFYHGYATTGLKTIIFKIYDMAWAYDAATTTVNIVNPPSKIGNYSQGSLVGSAEARLAAMVAQLQEMLRSLR